MSCVEQSQKVKSIPKVSSAFGYLDQESFLKTFEIRKKKLARPITNQQRGGGEIQTGAISSSRTKEKESFLR